MGWTGGLPPAPPGGWGTGLAPESRSPSVCPGQSQAPGIASEIAALVAQEDLHRTPTPPSPAHQPDRLNLLTGGRSVQIKRREGRAAFDPVRWWSSGLS